MKAPSADRLTPLIWAMWLSTPSSLLSFFCALAEVTGAGSASSICEVADAVLVVSTSLNHFRAELKNDGIVGGRSLPISLDNRLGLRRRRSSLGHILTGNSNEPVERSDLTIARAYR